MMMLDSGSRGGGTRSHRRGNNNTLRPNARGGIQKRSGSAGPRVDRDGDLEMDSSSKAGGGRGRGGRPPPGQGRGSQSMRLEHNARDDSARNRRPVRNPFNTDAIRKAIAQGSSGITNIRERGGLRMQSVIEEARGDRRGRSTKPPLTQLYVRGWRSSKAASNPGGGVPELIKFLERKASAPDHSVRISKSRVEKDDLLIWVSEKDTPSFTHLDKFTFAGAELHIGVAGQGPEKKEPGMSNEGVELKEKMTKMLGRRYNPETKLLDLSALGTDPEFANSGMFDTAERQSKFFPAIMKVCDSIFTTAAQKRESVLSVSIASNNLPNVATVTTLSYTFPYLKNLDLSNNQFQNLESLEQWRRRFRSLDHLVMHGNPIEHNVPNYQEEIIKWFPTLRLFNSMQVRTDEEVAAAKKSKIRAPISPPLFLDESGLGADFIKHFFSAYDSDRATLVAGLYDSESTFSYSVNVAAVRAPNSQTASWDAYVKKSRNLTKITLLPTRMARIYHGTEQIRDMWLSLPSSRHPDLILENEKWCIECQPLLGLPDPANRSTSGTSGIVIITHGEYGEVDVSTSNITVTRSFDRTFILGPGSGIGGIRVVSDVMVVRAHGGNEAWRPTTVQQHSPTLMIAAASGAMGDPSVPQPPPAIMVAAPLQAAAAGVAMPPLPAGFAQSAPGKTDEQVQKELLVLELSKVTRLTLEYSHMALEQTNFDLAAAGQAFEQVKATLPAEAFF